MSTLPAVPASRADARGAGARAVGVRVVGAVARFLTSVALVSGVLLGADVVVTLEWQEPITALFTTVKQDQLAGSLQQLTLATAPLRRRFDRVHDVRLRLAELAAAYRSRAQIGSAIGRIEMPTLGRSYVVVQGTNTSSLELGPAHYPGTDFPGQGGTVAIAGHRTTFLAPFRTINELRPGQPIILQMPYGRFVYRVQYARLVLPTDLAVARSVGYERLVMSACNPLFSAAQRIVVFSRLVREAPAGDRARRRRQGCVSTPRPGLLSPCSPALSPTRSRRVVV